MSEPVHVRQEEAQLVQAPADLLAGLMTAAARPGLRSGGGENADAAAGGQTAR